MNTISYTNNITEREDVSSNDFFITCEVLEHTLSSLGQQQYIHLFEKKIREGNCKHR
jgi:hypothetical protein